MKIKVTTIDMPTIQRSETIHVFFFFNKYVSEDNLEIISEQYDNTSKDKCQKDNQTNDDFVNFERPCIT